MAILRHFVPFASVLAGAAVLAGCAYNEALGRNQLLVVDEAAMIQASNAAWTEAITTQKVSRDAAANARVRRVGDRIVQAAGLAGRNWTYAVFEEGAPNAFVLPSGQIGVTASLLALVRNDDQLAAVIGHEVGHVVARHAAERYSNAALANVGVEAVRGAAGDRASQAGAAAGVFAQYGALLPFSRRDELEADRLGVDYMQGAGYRPSESVALWRLMAQQRQAGVPEFISTHPSDATRIQALEQYIAERGWA
ncbi:M48 family metallopeptidase [Brevundimonas sp.]|uniref:M48 family metallopeptidase n=1 Tax=Brevundimonas sp. TaxID=1871086 RepID=UPI003A5C3B94